MKTKLFLVALFLMFGGMVANAQLSTGEPTSKVIRTGNRAKAGDYGIYVGATTTMFGNIFNDDVDMTPLPLINFKYMASDSFEWRIGLEVYNLTEKLGGTVLTDEEIAPIIANKYTESTIMLYPGFAHHFSNMNIMDVYIGMEVPIGYDTNSVSSEVNNAEYSGSDLTTKNAFVIGVGAFIGLQAYVADLPIAIGVEYGFSARLDAGLKYKNVSVEGTTATTVYTSDLSKFTHIPTANYNFSKLNARRGEIGSQLRFTLSYYFK